MTRSTVTPASAWKLLTVALLVVALLGSADASAKRRRNKDTDGDKVKNGWVTDSWIDFSWTVCSPCFLMQSPLRPTTSTTR